MAAEGGWVRTQKRKKLMNKGNNGISLFAVIVTVFKGTVTVIINNQPCKHGNARFTTVPLKPFFLIKNVEDMSFCRFKVFGMEG